MAKPRFPCPVCFKPLANRWSLTTHLLTHDPAGKRQFRCSFSGCKFAAAQLGNVKIHKLTHTDKKLFPCPVPDCKKSFRQRGQLIQHSRMHNDNKPFFCQLPGCGHRTRQQSNLNICEKEQLKQTGKAKISWATRNLEVFPSQETSKIKKSNVFTCLRKSPPKNPVSGTDTTERAEKGTILNEGLVENPSVKYRIGLHVFYKGEKVFAKWTEDGRGYPAIISGTRQSKFRIEWCTDDIIGYVQSVEVIRENEILMKDTRVSVIVTGEAFYTETIFVKQTANDRYLLEKKNGETVTKSFKSMMIEKEEIVRMKKTQLQ